MDGEGLIINGRRVAVPGVRVVTWLDDERIPRVTKVNRRRASAVSAVVLHTSRGVVGVVRDGAGDDGKALRLARYQVTGSREASWHLTVGGAGTVYQQADLADDATWHASQANPWSVGIECAQSADTPDLTRAQVDACVAVVRAICEALNIPRRVPVRAHDGGASWSPESAPVKAWQPRKQGGESRAASGVIGHRNLTRNRGPGDPGDPLMLALLAAGFAGVAPEAMTVGTIRHADDAPTAEPDDAHDEDTDAPQWPPLPSWLDPALEVDASRDLPDDLAAFVRAQWAVLAGQGLDRDQAAGLIAHAATECGRGRRAIGFNAGGCKLKRREYDEAIAKTGHGLRWWRDLGHTDSGDDEVEYYRAFDNFDEFWRYWMKRFLPREVAADTIVRYAATGAAFWRGDASWFWRMLASGYRGSVRQKEVEATIAAGGDPASHPSVRAWADLTRRVRGML